MSPTAGGPSAWRSPPTTAIGRSQSPRTCCPRRTCAKPWMRCTARPDDLPRGCLWRGQGRIGHPSLAVSVGHRHLGARQTDDGNPRQRQGRRGQRLRVLEPVHLRGVDTVTLNRAHLFALSSGRTYYVFTLLSTTT